jgi:hypothetical protein
MPYGSLPSTTGLSHREECATTAAGGREQEHTGAQLLDHQLHILAPRTCVKAAEAFKTGRCRWEHCVHGSNEPPCRLSDDLHGIARNGDVRDVNEIGLKTKGRGGILALEEEPIFGAARR